MITMAKCLHGCSLSCFLEVGEGKARFPLPVLSGLYLFRSEPFAWVPRGVYIGLPPRGYNGNPAGRGSQPFVSQVAVFSADCWGPLTSGPRRQAWYCSRASNDAGLVMGLWQQCRRLADDHCHHSPSCLVNGVRGPWEGLADSPGPTPNGSVLWRSCRLLCPR